MKSKSISVNARLNKSTSIMLYNRTIAINGKVKSGLVLLVVLGMLGLFSLLAISYLSITGSSRTSSQALVRAKLQNIPVGDYSADVIRQIVRGNTNNKSALSNHSLLEDVYGRDAIQGTFVPATLVRNYLAPATPPLPAPFAASPEVGIVKIQLQRLIPNAGGFDNDQAHRITINPDGLRTAGTAAFFSDLSVEDDTYSGRLITFLDGPLANQTFRILSYRGCPATVNSGSYSPDGYEYSIAIDLSDVDPQETYTPNAGVGSGYTFNGTDANPRTLQQWLAYSNGNLLIGDSVGNGYRYLINDVPFNGLGIGVESDASHPTFGRLDQSRQVPGAFLRPAAIVAPNPPSGTPGALVYNPGQESFPIALLPNYDYLAPSKEGSVGLGGLNGFGAEIHGSNNEGYDVADYRDYFLAHLPAPTAGDGLLRHHEIIPSFHRPELVNYIAQYYHRIVSANSSLNANEIRCMIVRMVRLIDFACARPLSYRVANVPVSFPYADPAINSLTREMVVNPDFSGRSDARAIPSLDIDLNDWGNPGQPALERNLRAWVAALVGGGALLPNGFSRYAYDVDNDGNGDSDSVWIDPNLPLVSAADGKQLKVLASTMILDLDSRLNLNAHGDWYHLNFFQVSSNNDDPADRLDNTATAGDNLKYYVTRAHAGEDMAVFQGRGNFAPQGLGYGPAEISLARLFGGANLRAPYTGNNLSFFSDFFSTRYGRDGAPARYNINDSYGLYHRQREAFNGINAAKRGIMGYAVDRLGGPRTTESFNATLASVTYPVTSTTTTTAPEFLDDPYETEQLSISDGDSQFTLQELEALLRRYDSDVSALPDRIKKLLNVDTGYDNLSNNIYKSLTTRSVELRYPNIAALSRHTRLYAKNNRALSYPRNTEVLQTTRVSNVPESFSKDLNDAVLGNRLIANGRQEGGLLRFMQMLYEERYPGGATGLPILEMSDLRNLMPFEFRKGLRLDLNRPFGNGLDNDGDFVADDPNELRLSTEAEFYPGYSSITGQTGMNYPWLSQSVPPTGWPGFNASIYNYYLRPLESRKLFAAQLYCLVQLVIPIDYPFGGLSPAADPTDLTNLTNRTYRARRARELAQWCVNVVDFRDGDSAMTRFEYDTEPFTATEPDGVGTEPSIWYPQAGNVVWGMEFPELLMTETLAFHDKRVRDLATDTGSSNTIPNKTTTDMMDPDEEFDQYRIPQGSLFIELFCPRSINDPTTGTQIGHHERPSSSLYDTIPAGTAPQLNLSRLTPTPPGGIPAGDSYGQQPVFRIAITAPLPAGTTPMETITRTAFGGATPAIIPLAAQTNQVYSAPRAIVSANPANYGGGFDSSGLVEDVTRLTGSAPTSVPIERMIWFTHGGQFTPTAFPRVPDLPGGDDTANNSRRIFYNQERTSDLTVPSGGYLVVGPRPVTEIGSTNNGSATNPYSPSTQTIQLLGTPLSFAAPPTSIPATPPNSRTVFHTDIATGVSRTLPASWTTNAPTVAIVASQPQPGGTAAFPNGIGANVSTPMPMDAANYPIPTSHVSTDASWASLPLDAYVNGSGQFPDVPFDQDMTSNPYLANPGTNRHRPGTYLNERVAYLQRVADPELPYHPIYNPYITIDWMPIDLTVFNGETSATNITAEDPIPEGFAFQSRYKDGARMQNTQVLTPASGTPNRAEVAVQPRNAGIGSASETGVSIFSSSTAQMLQSTAYSPAALPAMPPFFRHELGFQNEAVKGFFPANPVSSMTLGYLNTGRPLSATAVATPQVVANLSQWDGFGPPSTLVSPGGGVTVNSARFAGTPLRPQAGLFWFNRPFVNTHELMLVPKTAPGQLGQFFSTPRPTPFVLNRYEKTTTPQPLDSFGHLPNWFSNDLLKATINSERTSVGVFWPSWQRRPLVSGGSDPTEGPVRGANWNLLLELVETPPVFSDSEKWTRPDNFHLTNDTRYASADYLRRRLLSPFSRQVPGTAANDPWFAVGGFAAPFNSMPTYRVPGKINLNTIAHDEVWKALEWAYDNAAKTSTGASASFTAIKNARRGYVKSSGVQTGTFALGNSGSFLLSNNALNPDEVLNENLDQHIPSQFAGADRPGFSANIDVAPQFGDIGNPYVSATHPYSALAKERSSTGTLLKPNFGPTSVTVSQRSNAMFAGAAVNNTFNVNAESDQSLLLPVNGGTPFEIDTALRQPFTNYQRAMRLPNLTTNQSNVFAVWITIGLFEYDPEDGIGREYVGPSGVPERSKSFYVVDRSIPVGFAPGKQYNTDKTILLRRKVSE
ncbi:MAG: hypothetical protein NTW52_01960 [Planctomycetota bacterium]|nr:hypothetical protein [Planctomycetota bacterium]